VSNKCSSHDRCPECTEVSANIVRTRESGMWRRETMHQSDDDCRRSEKSEICFARVPRSNTSVVLDRRILISEDEYPLTVREAAKFLGVSQQTVYLWVERKQIPHLRVMGRNIRFLKSELVLFRASFKQEMENV